MEQLTRSGTVSRARGSVDVTDRPTLASWFVAAFAFVAVGRLTELLPFLASLSVAKVLFGMAALSILVQRDRLQGHRILQSTIVRIAVALYSLAWVSGLFSVWRSNTLTYVTGDLLIVFLSFFVAVKAMSNWASVKLVLNGLVCAGLLLAFVGLLGYSTGRLSASQSYDANDLAYVLVSIMPLVVGHALISTGARRALWAGAAALMAFAILLTQSRGGFLALLMLVLLLGIWYRDPSSSKKFRFPLARFAKTLAVVTISGIVVWPLLPDDARARLASITNISADYNVDVENTTGRLSVWKRSAYAGLKRPIGYGAGNFATVDWAEGGRYKASHNSFLQVFVELGFMGLLLYIAMYAASWKAFAMVGAFVIYPGKGRSEQFVLMQAARLTLIGTAIAGFFLSQTFSTLLWMMFAVAASVTIQSSGRKPVKLRPGYSIKA